MKKRTTKTRALTKEKLQTLLDKKTSALERLKKKHQFESAVEAALERVRSLSLNMNKSEELFNIIQLILDQFILLKIKVESASFALNPHETDDLITWTAVPGALYPFKLHIPYFDHPINTPFKTAKEKGLDFTTITLTFEEKNQWLDHIYKYIKGVPEERKKHNYNSPGYSGSNAIRKQFSLNIFNYTRVPYSATENEVLRRFANVFEQAYSRFLDLQKAEANAMEAVKNATLDRVRAQTASMRTPDDLQRITPLLWNELTTLGVHFTRCGVFIMDDELEQIHTYLSTPDGKAIASFNTSYANPGLLTDVFPYWRRMEIYKTHWDENAFLEQARNLVAQGAIASQEAYLTENPPSSLHLHFLPFLQGMLYVGAAAPLSDEHLQLVKNLADAFSAAYARYEDFIKLELAKAQVEKTLVELKQTQAQLIHAEKMASLGELTAGIAHEIQNPLNFVNNFAEVSTELVAELNAEIGNGNIEEAQELADFLKQNLEKITHHGKRAADIVKGMLQHSRTSSGVKEPTNINALADEYLRLAYHGLRAKDKSFDAIMKTDFDDAGIGNINIIPQDIGRVILNLITNAFYAVNARLNESFGQEKAEQYISGYEPTVSVSTKKAGDKVLISVKDNGNGIPQKILDKIFQPFFTTKPTGQGTGLGLSLSYDIVKAHGGEIKVETKENEGTEFTVSLPA